MGQTTSRQQVQVAQPAPTSQGEAPAASSCPVVGQGYKNPAVYNVYNQRINDPNAPVAQNPLSSLKDADVLDPRNNMPLEPNQLPCPGQRKILSTERSVSGIPKGGTENTWLFPSPQMVFNGASSQLIAIRPQSAHLYQAPMSRSSVHKVLRHQS